MRLDKILPAGMTFPYDFGFIPATQGEDGDPLDVLLLNDAPTFPGCVVPARIIGVIEAEQSRRQRRSFATTASSRSSRLGTIRPDTKRSTRWATSGWRRSSTSSSPTMKSKGASSSRSPAAAPKTPTDCWTKPPVRAPPETAANRLGGPAGNDRGLPAKRRSESWRLNCGPTSRFTKGFAASRGSNWTRR